MEYLAYPPKEHQACWKTFIENIMGIAEKIYSSVYVWQATGDK